MVLTVSFALSPVTGFFCHRRLRIWLVQARSGRHASARLDISVGAQDHTTSPSAHASSSCAPRIAHRFEKPALQSHCAPDAAASTASRPTFVTIAIRPSLGRDGAVIEVIWVKREAKYFCNGLDRVSLICPSGAVIPGRAEREPGIQNHRWLLSTARRPRSRNIDVRRYGFRGPRKEARPGMTEEVS